MYLQFFGMSRMPFGARTEGEPLFLAGSHNEALATLVYGLMAGKPLIVLTGDVGLGKSTLLRAALAKVTGQELRVVSLPHPLLLPQDLLRLLGEALGMPNAQSLRLADVGQFHRAMLGALGDRARLALVIDEAQVLPKVTLEFVRLLSNLEAGLRGLFQVVLVGQPELWDRLQQRAFRQLRQRIAIRAELNPLPRRDAADYIEFCMRAAQVPTTQVFEPGALRALVRLGQGAPRRLNYIADNALLRAFADNVRPAAARHIREGAKSLDGEGVPAWQRFARLLRWRSATTLLGLVMLAHGVPWPGAPP
jgi:general secretion pathway protein A